MVLNLIMFENYVGPIIFTVAVTYIVIITYQNNESITFTIIINSNNKGNTNNKCDKFIILSNHDKKQSHLSL